MPTLFLRCRSCDAEFPTPIAVTEEGLGGVMITGMLHRCPSCGEENDYSTHDYFIPTSASSANSADATVGGDNAANEETERNAEVDRLSGFGVERDPPSGRRPLPPAESASDGYWEAS
jgi:hypothetical protein